MSHFPFPGPPTPGDLPRLLSGSGVHQGFPPQTVFRNSPLDGEDLGAIRPRRGVHPGPGEPIGSVGDWWRFSIADLEAHDLGAWVPTAQAILRAVPLASPVLAAFNTYLSIPLIWEVPPMPAFPEHFRLAWGGSLFGGPEGWTNRLNLTSATALMTDAQADAALAAMVAAVEAYCDGTAYWLSNAATLGFVKLNRIAPNGKYANAGNTREQQYPVERAATSAAAPVQAPQICLVQTLTTGLKRGRAHVGRIYIPALGATVGSDGRVMSGEGEGPAGVTLTFINAVNAAAPGDTAVSVVSSFGDAHMVTGVRAGRVLDTQRRRRKRLSEAPFHVATGTITP